ncbi:hypothetical protein J4760_08110 [Salinicoccus sp. ID82-1]|uniref:Uncharacterized protein n=1 Tax=Salinicoccus cyprini TaxID=2493691 RepID=A0A558AX66_9STAP|nr:MULTISPECIES: hypothetical protein [Salinicoccus]MCG1009981.1 hypothetical protein [Salinicoccus sp. ID82-1]TVT28847.1 hypothetical protein FO441_00785 [Salinicoccus cyprini]
MAGVDWKKAYHDLESHIEHIMKETSTLVHNAVPELRINEVARNDQNGLLEIIIDATGARMKYALYLIDRTGKHETIKRPYQQSNTFLLDVPGGKYTLQAFVQEDGAADQTASVKINFRHDRVDDDE